MITERQLDLLRLMADKPPDKKDISQWRHTYRYRLGQGAMCAFTIDTYESLDGRWVMVHEWAMGGETKTVKPRQ